MGMREFQAKMRLQQELAQAQAQNTVAQVAETKGDQYDALEIALRNDIGIIRAIPTLEQRQEHKRNHFLPKWLPFVDAYLAKGKVYQNAYFIYCIIYLLDIGDFDKALNLADKAIAQNQPMPEGFKSNLPTFIANQMFSWADKTNAKGESVEPYFSMLFEKVASQWQLHELLTANWYKFTAKLLLQGKDGETNAANIDDPERIIQAITLATKAWQLNPKAGVKSLIERCFMRLNALKKLEKYDEEAFPPLPSFSSKAIALDVADIVKKLKAGQVLTAPNTHNKTTHNKTTEAEAQDV